MFEASWGQQDNDWPIYDLPCFWDLARVREQIKPSLSRFYGALRTVFPCKFHIQCTKRSASWNEATFQSDAVRGKMNYSGTKIFA